MADIIKVSELTSAAKLNNTDLLLLSQGSAGNYASLNTTLLALANKIVSNTNYTSDLNTNSKTIIGALNEIFNSGNLADTYDTVKTYEVGDYCIYQGLLYKCVAQTTGEFYSDAWVQTTITRELSNGGTTVIANPTGTPTDELNSIQIGSDIYEIVGGSSAGWTDIVGTLEAGATEIILTSSKIKTTSAVFPWTDKFGIYPTNMVVDNGIVTLTFPVQTTDLGVMVRVTEVSGTPEPTPIDTTNTSKYSESSMNVVSSSSQMESVWNGGSSIGLTFYLTNPIDVTNLSKLSYELQTKSCYGLGSQAEQERWNVQIGLMTNSPSSILNATYSELNFVAGGYFANSNTNYGTQEIDVSSLSGTYYFIVNAHGWNATISNLRGK